MSCRNKGWPLCRILHMAPHLRKASILTLELTGGPLRVTHPLHRAPTPERGYYLLGLILERCNQ